MAATNAPVNLDAVHALAEEAYTAGFRGRKAVAATLHGRAASLARELCGPSLVDAFLTTWRVSSVALVSQLAVTTPDDALKRRVEASALLMPLNAYLEDREREDTLKPGRCRAVEIAFYKWWLRAKGLANEGPVMPPDQLAEASRCIGYAAFLSAARYALTSLYIAQALTSQQGVRAMIVVPKALDLMLAVRFDLLGNLAEERCFVGDVTRMCSIQPRDGFRTMLSDKMNAPAFRAMLRARNIGDDLEAEHLRAKARLEAVRKSDEAKVGLKSCALRSCGKREACAKQFHYCSACHAAWYCCNEHAQTDWASYRAACRRLRDAAAAAKVVQQGVMDGALLALQRVQLAGPAT